MIDDTTPAERDPDAAVEAWRTEGGARIDPVGFAVIEALARRAQAQQGEARQFMIARLHELLQAQRAAAKPTAAQPTSAQDELAARRHVLAGLSELVDRLGRAHAPAAAPPPPHKAAGRRKDARATLPTSASPASQASPPAPRNAITAFKSTWSRLRADRRLREALAQVPTKAGPLNSSHVVNRTLQAMRDISPEYLDAFMLHVDTLQWLEQESNPTDPAPRAAPPPERARSAGPKATRKG